MAEHERVSTRPLSGRTPTVHDIPTGQYAGSVAGPLLALMALGLTPSARAMVGNESFAVAPAVTGLLQSLKAERKRVKAEGDALHAQATAAGAYTDEQRTQRDGIIAKLDQLDADIEAEESLTARLLADDPVGEAEPQGAPQLFGSLGEQLLAIKHAALRPEATDKRLDLINAEFNAAVPGTGSNTTVGADGGFLIQKDFQPGILDRIFEGSQLAQLTTPREIGAGFNGTAWNVIDETSRADGSRGGGVQAYWIAEGATITASRPKLRRQEATLGKLAAMWYATDEQLQDATATESFAEAEFVDELAFKLDDAIFRGTGAGIPKGILNAEALVSVAKEAGQAAGSIEGTNIKKMFARMAPRSLGKGIWFINQELWPQVFDLHQVIGVGGVPLFIPAAGLTEAPGGTLLGRPIRVIEQAEAPGTVGDITFLDLSRYLLLRKGGVQKAVSIHVQFLTDETAFRWILRVNGRPMPVSAITPYKGSATISPFVALATRS